jgi:hypothetical protein
MAFILNKLGGEVMKEATGEANMTVVTVILITAVVAIATPIVTTMMSNVKERSDCNNSGGYWSGGKCVTSGSTVDLTG